MTQTHIRSRLMIAAVVLLVGSIALSAFGIAPVKPAAAGAPSLPAAPTAIPGKLIVAFPTPGLTEAQVVATLARHGLVLDRWLPELRLARATVKAGAEAAAVTALDADPQIEYATEDRLSVQAAETPGDEYWDQQWGPAKVGLSAARDLTWGDRSAVIAIVDSGVNYFHWDLRDQMWINPGESEIDPATGKRTCNTGIAQNGQDDDDNGYVDDCRGYNFDTGSNDPADVYGHGTAVAGIAGAATNNPGHYSNGKVEGMAGMGGAARIMPLRVFNASGAGSPFNIADAIRYAANQGSQVINLSLSLDVIYNPDDAATLCRATDFAQSKGALVVAASGNHSAYGLQPVSYPAACAGVIAVGASTQADTRASFSDGGSRLDLVAPGDGIFSTLRSYNTEYGLFGRNHDGRGTSFAAPHVAGAAALLRALRPDLGVAQAAQVLRDSAADIGDPGFDDQTGWGRLDVARAISATLDGLALRVAADPPSVSVWNSTQMRVRVTGPGGGPVGFGARIHLVSALGVVSPTVVTVDATGAALATFTAGATPGAGAVTATLGPIAASLPITISSGIPAAIQLSSEPPILPSGGRAAITAAVLDDGGNPVSAPFDVTFSASLGTVDPVVTKTVAGKATTTFNADATSGTAAVHAAAGNLAASLDLPVLGAGEPFTVTLAATPATTQAGGQPVELTVIVTDSSGKPVVDGSVVSFSTDLGVLSVPSAATRDGRAAVKLTPGTVAGQAHVAAKAGLVQGAVAVPIVAGPAAAVDVSADPQELVAELGQLATITAIAKDVYGNVAADGTTIQFGATLGELVAASARMQGGRSQVQFSAGTIAGTALVTATAPGGASGTATVKIRPGGPAQMTLSGQPLELTVSSGASRLRATVKDVHGNLVASGVPVTFITDLGQLQPPGGGTAGGATLVALTSGGVAEADLVPGSVAGVAQVRAAVSAELKQSLSITVRPAGPAQLVLSAQPVWVTPGGRVDIAAHVTDPYGNAVADGVSVTFGVSRGQLYQSVVPTVDGYAAAWFAAPAAPGPVQVIAISGGISAAALTVQVARPVYLPLLSR